MTDRSARAPLAQRIRDLRLERDLTLEQVGEGLRERGLRRGHSRSHLSQIETNQAWPSVALLRALEQVFDARGRLMPLLARAKTSAPPSEGSFRVLANLYFPVHVGRDQAETITPSTHPTMSFRWIPPRSVLDCEGSKLYVFDCGVAVAHESHLLEEPDLVGVAVWRSEQIERSPGAGEAIAAQAGLEVPVQASDPYCLATLELLSAPWDTEDRLDRCVQLLANPSVLATACRDYDEGWQSDASRVRAEDLQATLLASPRPDPELQSFSLAGHHLGWASWSGAACHVMAPNSPLAALMHEFEVQLQALWCLASNLATAPASQSCGPDDAVTLRMLLRKLRSPEPTEHLAQRSLREALIATSRVEDVVSAAIDALSDEFSLRASERMESSA